MKRASLTEEIFKNSTKPAYQRKQASAGIQVRQQIASDAPPVKKTYYFDLETRDILERERFKRRTAGQRIGSDFSALIREAVKKAFVSGSKRSGPEKGPHTNEH